MGFLFSEGIPAGDEAPLRETVPGDSVVACELWSSVSSGVDLHCEELGAVEGSS